jgi:alcohol dehydrogenase (cytochrome c)
MNPILPQLPRVSPVAMSLIAAASFSNGKVYYNTLEDYTICVDANSGKEVWRTKLGDINTGETITIAPLVVHDKVLVGNSGGELGVRGWLTAVDANSGKIVWRAWSTGSDADCLIGPEFKPYYDSEKGKDLGIKTWPPNAGRSAGAMSGAGSPTTQS